MARPYRTRRKKRASSLNKRKYQNNKKKGGSSDLYVILIPYRARHPQEEKRNHLIKLLTSIEQSFTKANKRYHIIISEPNNDYPFNRGLQHNISFLEGEKMFPGYKKYLHMNCDYEINVNHPFPKGLDEFKEGILDVFTQSTNHYNVFIGGCCCFDPESFKKINGFPNTFFGWGWDDGVFLKRVKEKNIPYIINNVSNDGWIFANDNGVRNTSRGNLYAEKTKTDILEKDGLSNCVYTINGKGEFENPSKHITHLLCDFPYVEPK